MALFLLLPLFNAYNHDANDMVHMVHVNCHGAHVMVLIKWG
jgi:hypothetical protein